MIFSRILYYIFYIVFLSLPLIFLECFMSTLFVCFFFSLSLFLSPASYISRFFFSYIRTFFKHYHKNTDRYIIVFTVSQQRRHKIGCREKFDVRFSKLFLYHYITFPGYLHVIFFFLSILPAYKYLIMIHSFFALFSLYS